MNILNTRPYPTSVALGRLTSGEPFVGVILKATFTMPTGRGLQPARSAARQIPIFDADEPLHAEQPGGLLQFESDRVPFKPRADIILLGNAWVPHGRTARCLDVELRIGATHKVLRIFGDRAWAFSPGQLAPSIVGPAEFTSMPLEYDRAFGGIDEKSQIGGRYPSSPAWHPFNVHGRGYIGALTHEAIHGRALPNIEDPDDLVQTWDACPVPAGCGFFPRDSLLRRRHAGTFDECWRAERAPAPPSDFSFELYNAAHPDLQISNYLVGNEAVELSHVHPLHPVLQLRLPCLKPRLRVLRAKLSAVPATEPEFVPFHLDTAVFMPEESVFYLVWRATSRTRDVDSTDIEELRIDYERLAVSSAESL